MLEGDITPTPTKYLVSTYPRLKDTKRTRYSIVSIPKRYSVLSPSSSVVTIPCATKYRTISVSDLIEFYTSNMSGYQSHRYATSVYNVPLPRSS